MSPSSPICVMDQYPAYSTISEELNLASGSRKMCLGDRMESMCLDDSSSGSSYNQSHKSSFGSLQLNKRASTIPASPVCVMQKHADLLNTPEMLPAVRSGSNNMMMFTDTPPPPQQLRPLDDLIPGFLEISDSDRKPAVDTTAQKKKHRGRAHRRSNFVFIG